MDMKKNNINELKKAKSKGKILTDKHLCMDPDSPYSNGKGGRNANNNTDFIIKDKKGNKPETIELGKNLANYDISNINNIIKKIMNNAKKNKTVKIEISGITFTLPKYIYAIHKHYEAFKERKELYSIIKQLIMIGVNDNGRYQTGENPGFINHMSTLLASVHLFHDEGNKDIKKLLMEKGITDSNTFKKYLYNNGIIRYDDIVYFI